MTVSLGVLKNNFQKMFVPSLTSKYPAKANAIQRLSIGTMNKILVVFNQSSAFKLVGSSGLQLVWRTDKPLNLPKSDAKWNLTVNFVVTIFICMLIVVIYLYVYRHNNFFRFVFQGFFNTVFYYLKKRTTAFIGR